MSQHSNTDAWVLLTPSCSLLDQKRPLVRHLTPLVDNLDAYSSGRCRLVRRRRGRGGQTEACLPYVESQWAISKTYGLDDPLLLGASVLPGFPKPFYVLRKNEGSREKAELLFAEAKPHLGEVPPQSVLPADLKRPWEVVQLEPDQTNVSGLDFAGEHILEPPALTFWCSPSSLKPRDLMWCPQQPNQSWPSATQTAFCHLRLLGLHCVAERRLTLSDFEVGPVDRVLHHIGGDRAQFPLQQPPLLCRQQLHCRERGGQCFCETQNVQRHTDEDKSNLLSQSPSSCYSYVGQEKYSQCFWQKTQSPDSKTVVFFNATCFWLFLKVCKEFLLLVIFKWINISDAGLI